MENLETYEPEIPFPETNKPTPQKLPEPTPSLPVQKRKPKTWIWILVGIIIGAALVIVAVQFNVSSMVTTTNNCVLGMQQSFNLGAETLIIQIMNESLQCNQIPINYDNYSVTLIPVECLNLNNQEV